MWLLVVGLAIILVVILIVTDRKTKTDYKGKAPKWHGLMTYITDDLYVCFTQEQVNKVLNGYKHDIENYRSDPVFWKQLNDFLISMGWQRLN